jgi:hypothetical protein
MIECVCGLPLEPSSNVRHWHPDHDPEPRDVTVVTRFGQRPELRQAVRVSVDQWIETGALVGYYTDRTRRCAGARSVSAGRDTASRRHRGALTLSPTGTELA